MYCSHLISIYLLIGKLHEKEFAWWAMVEWGSWFEYFKMSTKGTSTKCTSCLLTQQVETLRKCSIPLHNASVSIHYFCFSKSLFFSFFALWLLFSFFRYVIAFKYDFYTIFTLNHDGLNSTLIVHKTLLFLSLSSSCRQRVYICSK